MAAEAVAVPLSRGMTATVDARDARRVLALRWFAVQPDPTVNSWYAMRQHRDNGRVITLYMHRLIIGAPPRVKVDHRDGHTLNNMRSNLRIAPGSGNNANQRKTHGSSRFKGVSWDTSRGKWLACIQHLGRRQKIGVFVIEADGALAYDEMARELFGEFAAVNFPRAGERGCLTGQT